MTTDMFDKPWSLLAFHAAAAARNGYTAITPLSDATQYVVQSTNDMKFARKGKISYGLFRTAGIANFAKGRFRETSMRDYIESYLAIDQTGQLAGKSDLLKLGINIESGSIVNCDIDNGNNSQIDDLGVFYGADGVEFYNSLPEGYEAILMTATVALTANVWSDPGTVTFSKTFKPNAIYHIGGMAGFSATGYFARLVNCYNNWRPGIPVGDTQQLQRPYFTDFGKFIGHTPPTLEWLASGTDADVYATLFVKEIGKIAG